MGSRDRRVRRWRSIERFGEAGQDHPVTTRLTAFKRTVCAQLDSSRQNWNSGPPTVGRKAVEWADNTLLAQVIGLTSRFSRKSPPNPTPRHNLG
jgi:hypothetical protein